jgi:retron-type reverse transcriptase
LNSIRRVAIPAIYDVMHCLVLRLHPQRLIIASQHRAGEIVKPGSGERPLGIPTIRDRVVQTAAKLVLEPIFEADLEPSAYGYRPGRGGNDAVKAAHRLLC